MKIYPSIEDIKRVKLDFQEQDLYGKGFTTTEALQERFAEAAQP